ncbi:Bifunctional inhibitor/plant lipid transfer protein/seed storage helical domain [Arabidopsis suecica]|uniref:Bifunctional inhibitor/plant lipid transfer protein/seed storage helical domain n=1 Tax=Arabidopsis suecica TaxID=45249 RepID=A0A8T2BNI6_ARASU|nr:Bifunctional inhibitor/plant lipid transfer protein/seed storage helical domain [Arabidopsis suecica]
MALFSAATSLLLLVLSVSSPYVHGNIIPASGCTLVVPLFPCLSFITIGSTLDTPSSSCCSSLKNILDTKPQCLCEGLKNTASYGIKLNVTKATTLPDACKVYAPPVSACGALSPASPSAANAQGKWNFFGLLA